MKETEQQALCAIVDPQDNALRRLTGAPKIISVHSRRFVRWYEKQDSFQDIVRKAKYMLFTSSEDANEVKSRLSGGLFQDIASLYLAGNVTKNNPERRVVLAGSALSFFIDLYPNAAVIHNPVVSDSLAGAAPPDGLIVDKLRIVSVCEYTLNENQRHFESKYHKFRAKKRNFPELFVHSNLLFVVPKTFPIVMEQIKSAIGDSTVQFLELPFSRTEFGGFIERVCKTNGMMTGDEKSDRGQ